MDGAIFIREAPPESIDAVLIDAADTKAECNAALEAPPAIFVDEAFFREALHPALTARGFAVINVIASRERLQQLCNDISSVFASAWVLAMDPNYIFFVFKINFELPSEQLLELLDVTCTRSLFPHISEPIIARTAHFAAQNMLMGWISLERFRHMLNDGSVAV